MHPAFTQLEHRPWPVPARRWTWRQTWNDLLFAHWPVAASVLRRLVPPSLAIQEFLRTQVHHVAWPLQQAFATIETNELHLPHGIPISGPPSMVHFARRLDVVVWSPEVVSR